MCREQTTFDTMPDLLCCDTCGQVFELNRITFFIEHKVKGCRKRCSMLPSSFECAYCNFNFMLPLDLITHVQSIHNVPVLKSAKCVVGENCSKKSKCCTNGFGACNKGNLNSRINCSVDTHEACSSENILSNEDSGKCSSVASDNTYFDYQLQSPTNSYRKTCCLVDGGPPCTQITSCPILATYNSECDSAINSNESITGSGSNSATNSNDVGIIGQKNQGSPDSTDSHINVEMETSTKTTINIQRHPRSHSNAIFVCEYCSSSFKQKIHLKKHFMSTHLRQKPFKCAMCGYATVEKSHLTIHVRRHTGERPFACLLCNYKAAQHVTLKRHCLKKHQSTYVDCKTCGMQFVTLNELENHKKQCAL